MEPPGREAREMQERGQRDARGGDKRERLERFYFKKKERLERKMREGEMHRDPGGGKRKG